MAGLIRHRHKLESAHRAKARVRAGDACATQRAFLEHPSAVINAVAFA